MDLSPSLSYKWKAQTKMISIYIHIYINNKYQQITYHDVRNIYCVCCIVTLHLPTGYYKIKCISAKTLIFGSHLC